MHIMTRDWRLALVRHPYSPATNLKVVRLFILMLISLRKRLFRSTNVAGSHLPELDVGLDFQIVHLSEEEDRSLNTEER